MEVTTSFEALRCNGSPRVIQRPCGPATRVNAEQASKPGMREPTRRYVGEGCHWPGSERQAHRLVPPGYWRRHAWKRGWEQHGKPCRWCGTHQPEPREGQAGPVGVAERSVRLKTPGNAGRGKGPQVWSDDGRKKAGGSGDAWTPR